MEKREQQLQINERETLLKVLWDGKKGRPDRLNNYALYVGLNSPTPDLQALTRSMLEQLSDRSNVYDSYHWAEGWGRVVISVHPDQRLRCLLGDMRDNDNKNFVPVVTTQITDLDEMFKEFPRGSLGKILINRQPMTVEAGLISYIHMVDELIWDTFREKQVTTGSRDVLSLYQDAVAMVASQGFSVETATEEEILNARRGNPKVSVRLYGSGVNKSVPKVMGAFVPAGQERASEGHFLEQLRSEVELKDQTIAEPRVKTVGQALPLITVGVTLGKELHAGHLLLLGVADLMRFNTGSSEPLALFNNNTGPRAAGALVQIARRNKFTLEESAARLSSGDFELEEIVLAYRSRSTTGTKLDDAITLLDTGEFDIFSAMSDRMTTVLSDAGLKTSILPESAALANQDRLLRGLSSEWYGSGFGFSNTKGIKIIQKGGLLTATGKALVSLDALTERSANPSTLPTVVYIDGSADTHDAVAVFDESSTKARAMNIPGAAIGFKGKLASGTNGEALTVREAARLFNDARPNANLARALRHMILFVPVLMPTEHLSESFYDFRDNQSFIHALTEMTSQIGEFEEQVDNTLVSIKSKVASKSVGADAKMDKWLEFLPHRTDAFERVNLDEVVRAATRSKFIKGCITEYLTRMGYSEEESIKLEKTYQKRGSRLATRENYYLKALQGVLISRDRVRTYSTRDYEMIARTVYVCMERLGYETRDM